MEEKIPASNPGEASGSQPVAQPAPAPAQPAPAPVQPTQSAQTVIIQKSSPWPWIVGGCLMITLLIIGAVFFVGWWGAKQVKNEIQKYEPAVESFKNSADQISDQAEGWAQKSQELQESMPNPDDFPEEFKNIK